MEERRRKRLCEHCANPVPPEEYSEFFETGLCSWCLHQRNKMLDERDRGE